MIMVLKNQIFISIQTLFIVRFNLFHIIFFNGKSENLADTFLFVKKLWILKEFFNQNAYRLFFC
jgi:hypothetical protein